MTVKFTAIVTEVDGHFIGYAAEIPGVNSQGESRDEVIQNLKEAAVLVLETNREMTEEDLGDTKFSQEEISVEIPA